MLSIRRVALGMVTLVIAAGATAVFAKDVDKETVPTAVYVGGDSVIHSEEIKVRKKYWKKADEYRLKLSLVELPGVGDPVPLGEQEILIADATFVMELESGQRVFSVAWSTLPLEADSLVYACVQVITAKTGEVVAELCTTLEPIPLF